MSAEIATQESDDLTTPPPVVVETGPKPSNGKKPKRRPDDDETAVDTGDAETKTRGALSPAMKDLRRAEDLSLKDMIESLGDEGHFKIRVVRKEPEMSRDPASGKVLQTGGHLGWFHKSFDEDWIQQKFGGGKYEIYFRKKGEKGSWEYGGQRTVEIAGEPNLTEMPRDALPAALVSAPGVTADNPSIVKEAMGMMADQLKRTEERAERAAGRAGEPTPMIDLLRDELRASREQLATALRETREIQTRVPPEEKFKDSLLDKLMDQDTVRLQSVRLQYESELRQAKDSAIENEKRLRDSFERDRQDIRNAHEREIALLRQAHESQLASAKSSFETSASALGSSFGTQKEILAAENRRLERDNADLRVEVKDLRAKKEKTIVEQMKDIEVIREAIGGDDSDKGFGEKIVDAITNPEAIAAVSGIFNKTAAATPAPAAQPVERKRPRVAKDADGNPYIISPDGKIREAKRRGTPGSAPGEPEIPFIEPEMVAQVVGYLERAFTGNQEPEIVAQSGRAMVPEPVLVAIRDLGGLDNFLIKVAKLPSASVLTSSQAGRTWVRKVGKSLIGE